MALAILVLFLIATVSGCGYGVTSFPIFCELDYQCGDGQFCYEESHYCSPCLECDFYKRKSSWRSCAKTPLDCGACLSGYEEEILHEGTTRDMCIPSAPTPLSQSTVYDMSERFIWAAVVTALLLPIVFYAFCRKGWKRERGLPLEEPPPYRSIELTTLASENSNSEERLSEERVMHVGQQKDCLVQAVPFQQPSYADSELLVFGNPEEGNGDDEQPFPLDIIPNTPQLELEDENTMPSDWTPENEADDSQLMTFEPGTLSEEEDTCEPASKRHKTNGEHNEDNPCNNQQLNINLFINNNVTIHKPS